MTRQQPRIVCDIVGINPGMLVPSLRTPVAPSTPTRSEITMMTQHAAGDPFIDEAPFDDLCRSPRHRDLRVVRVVRARGCAGRSNAAPAQVRSGDPHE